MATATKASRADAQVIAVSFGCTTILKSGPVCGGGIVDPETGSFVIYRGTSLKAGHVQTCNDCGARLTVPSVKGITA